MMKKTNRGSAINKKIFNLLGTILVLILVVILAFWLNALLSVQTSRTGTQVEDDTPSSKVAEAQLSLTPTVTPTQTNSTPDWKTFTEQELSYSVKYPPDWKLGISKSDGYPYIQLLDPVAQQVVLPKTEIDQGAMIEIYIAPWLGQDKSISSLKRTLEAIDPTFGGLGSDPTAILKIRESSVRQIMGVRSSLLTKDYKIETFTFLKDYKDKTLVFRIVLTIFNHAKAGESQTEGYLMVFQQMLNTLEFASSE